MSYEEVKDNESTGLRVQVDPGQIAVVVGSAQFTLGYESGPPNGSVDVHDGKVTNELGTKRSTIGPGGGLTTTFLEGVQLHGITGTSFVKVNVQNALTITLKGGQTKFIEHPGTYTVQSSGSSRMTVTLHDGPGSSIVKTLKPGDELRNHKFNKYLKMDSLSTNPAEEAILFVSF